MLSQQTIDIVKSTAPILQEHGEVRKLLAEVDQITFSGAQALKQNQTVIYVTERAVFKLQEDGVHLIEIAPGVDLQRDIIEQMGFPPVIEHPPDLMSREYFCA